MSAGASTPVLALRGACVALRRQQKGVPATRVSRPGVAERI